MIPFMTKETYFLLLLSLETQDQFGWNLRKRSTQSDILSIKVPCDQNSDLIFSRQPW